MLHWALGQICSLCWTFCINEYESCHHWSMSHRCHLPPLRQKCITRASHSGTAALVLFTACFPSPPCLSVQLKQWLTTTEGQKWDGFGWRVSEKRSHAAECVITLLFFPKKRRRLSRALQTPRKKSSLISEPRELGVRMKGKRLHGRLTRLSQRPMWHSAKKKKKIRHHNVVLR